jgi:glycine betaine/proline transport system ATP-binding protein
VLKPADEYIARFVKEVNRGRVLQVGAVMGPVVSTIVPPRTLISVRTTLEETAKMLTQSGEESLAVVDDDGRMAGVVDIRQIVRAIAPPEPTPVGKSPIPNRRLIQNEDTLTPTVS